MDQFQKLAETVQKALGHTSYAHDIGNQLTKLRNKHKIWPAKIMATYNQYLLPPLSQQDISMLNQKHETRIADINDIRKHAKKAITASIDRLQKLSDDEMAKNDQAYQECRKQLDLINERLEAHRLNPNPAYTPEKIREMYAERSAHVKKYTDEHHRLLQNQKEHQEKKLV